MVSVDPVTHPIRHFKRTDRSVCRDKGRDIAHMIIQNIPTPPGPTSTSPSHSKPPGPTSASPSHSYAARIHVRVPLQYIPSPPGNGFASPCLV